MTIRRLLMANRGEIARRVFATCRSLGIETVAVYSDPDAGAPYVGEADLAVRLPGAAPVDTYLRVESLVEAARRSGADAVHPGYGFLAEDAGFAAAVGDAGLTWVGPPAKAIAAMGDKTEAKALLSDAGVPMLPTYADPERITAFPVLVKAAAGGGGRGMRIVREPADLASAISSARREAAATFGDGTVFVEPYVERARHVEVQVVADGHGTVLSLGERECSIQRRHQKIVEEAPSVAVTPELRAGLERAAVVAARAVGYLGVGTVEFLLTPAGEFHFLEMNTRLQVEHAVTECVTGLDLVRLQLLVAEGGALPATAPPVSGHAIEVRLCAEDPAADWLPATGTLHRFAVPGVDVEFGVDRRRDSGLRLDSGVRDGSVVGVHYDSMVAKLVAWAPTRDEAARALAGALRRARLHGVATNRDLLVRVLGSAEFRAGEIDTAFLDRHPEVFTPLLPPDRVGLAGLAAALAGAAARRAAAPVLGTLPSGWRNVPTTPQTIGYATPAGPLEIDYRLDRSGALVAWSARPADAAPPASDGAAQPGTGARPEVVLLGCEPSGTVLQVDGVRQVYAVHQVGAVCFVDGPDGSVTLTELPRYAEPAPELAEGSLLAPLPGTVSRTLVAVGQRVAAGEPLLVLEAMKLEHPVTAPGSGVVTELPVTAGSQVETGAVLAVVTPEQQPPA
ncbi:biotin carboxylase N-terminal domain-containing protein [Micromonospora sp. WMMD1102]|uniref:acetyl/propionyl/methylcrotonyl-CoA carboxylase subunit alpha n=1 Tax=Micromonospora sp. WMMD1102 TaxID=3016105 RepID=UPI0024151D72|nr:biotin carboxylase N-terminal domain-containing protein [Micromonospora sp. WMMD1102]MDG4791278.1 biotin carboxylase N-terminal domain-containing protein [Micromonospora sp. WMMD1102]